MKEIDVDKLIATNQKLLYLIGIMDYQLYKLSKELPESEKVWNKWIKEAIYNIVYADKPLPIMPDEHK